MSILSTRPKFAGVVASMLLLTAWPAGAASVETPDSFVRRVYERYRANGPGVPMARPGGDAFYTTALLDAFAKDQAGAQSEGVTIDWDPICGCQDYDLRLKTVTVAQGEAGAVLVKVSVANHGSRQTVLLTLVQTPAGWRIADVTNTNEKSIMTLLKDATTQTVPSTDAGLAPTKH